MEKVKCELCGQVMLEANGCTYTKIKCHGKIYDRIRVGEEFDSRSGIMEPTERCSDCGAEAGQYHHYRCALENHPETHEQMIDYDGVEEFIQ